MLALYTLHCIQDVSLPCFFTQSLSSLPARCRYHPIQDPHSRTVICQSSSIKEYPPENIAPAWPHYQLSLEPPLDASIDVLPSNIALLLLRFVVLDGILNFCLLGKSKLQWQIMHEVTLRYQTRNACPEERSSPYPNLPMPSAAYPSDTAGTPLRALDTGGAYPAGPSSTKCISAEKRGGIRVRIFTRGRGCIEPICATHLHVGFAFGLVVQRKYPPLRRLDRLLGAAEVHARHDRKDALSVEGS